jgi:hypothetical protein
MDNKKVIDLATRKAEKDLSSKYKSCPFRSGIECMAGFEMDKC